MTSAQCRAARAYLQWSQSYLANLAHVSLSTVRSFENGTHRPIANNLTAMVQAFRYAGMDPEAIQGPDLP